MFLYFKRYIKIFALTLSFFLMSEGSSWATEVKANPFFLRPEIVEVRQEHLGGQHGATYSIYEQKSETLELLPGLIFYKGTEYWTMKDYKAYIDKVHAPKGFTYKDALFTLTDESISFSMESIRPSSGITETDQYVTFTGLKEKQVKALKGSVVVFDRKVVLAENTAFDSGHEKSIQIHPKIVAKAGTEVEFASFPDGGLVPSSLVLAESYDFGGLVVPADSKIWLYRGKLGSIFSPKLWTAQLINVPEWTMVATKHSQTPEKIYTLLAPLPSGKLNFSQYKDYYCGERPLKDGKEMSRNIRWISECRFLLTTDITFDGVPLKKGCVVFIDQTAMLKGFNCPEKHEFFGLNFDKESTILFGKNFLHDNMQPEAPRACVTGKNIKFMSANFYDGFCVSFDKDRKPEYLWSKNNISVAGVIYFGPALLKVAEEKLVLISSSFEHSNSIDLGKSEDPELLPLCSKGGEIPLYDDKNLKSSEFSLPSCSSVVPSIVGDGVEYFYIQSKKNGVWKIKRDNDEDEQPSPIPAGKVFWIKETKDLSTPVIIKIGNVELMSPVLVVQSKPDLDLRVRYADESYIYLQGDLGACYRGNGKIFRLPRPKNLKIEDQPAALVPLYEVQEYMCNT